MAKESLDDEETKSVTVRAMTWLTKQKPETVLTFCVIGFLAYWMIYEHPKTVDRSREWHKAENVRTTDAIDAITTKQTEAQKEAAKLQAEAIERAAKLHADEVKDTTENYERTLNRVIDIYDRNHLRDKKE